MGQITVLLADDHTVVREATAEIVDHQPDMRVVGQAGTGEEAVALTCRLQPDVVVMDIAMPRLNGLEATRQIVQKRPDCKILILTAHEQESYIIQLLQAGAVGYLPKTIGLDELLEAVRVAARKEERSRTTIGLRHSASRFSCSSPSETRSIRRIAAGPKPAP